GLGWPERCGRVGPCGSGGVCSGSVPMSAVGTAGRGICVSGRRHAMSILAISDTAGSLGREIGRTVAAALWHEFADCEIISKAAERFGEGVLELKIGRASCRERVEI